MKNDLWTGTHKRIQIPYVIWTEVFESAFHHHHITLNIMKLSKALKMYTRIFSAENYIKHTDTQKITDITGYYCKCLEMHFLLHYVIFIKCTKFSKPEWCIYNLKTMFRAIQKPSDTLFMFHSIAGIVTHTHTHRNWKSHHKLKL